MGVMACGRKDCTHILCRRYSPRFGYICEECFEELKASHMPIAMFMNVAKNDLPTYNCDDEFPEKKETD